MESIANLVGCLHSEMECSHIISLAMKDLLPRLKQRLSEKEKRMIQPGYAFVYSEEESGIIRWTDSRTWTPSRALGPFMMYIEKREDNPLIKKIYTARFRDSTVHIVIYNVYNHEEKGICCDIYKDVRNKIIPESFSDMARTHLAQKKKRNTHPKKDNRNKKKDEEVEKRPRSLLYEKNETNRKNKFYTINESQLKNESKAINDSYTINKADQKTDDSYLTGGYSMMERNPMVYGYDRYDNTTHYNEMYTQYLTLDRYMTQYDITENCDNTTYIDLNNSQEEIPCEPIEVSKDKDTRIE